MSEYTSICQAVDKVDDDVREMFGRHFANLRQELLRRLGQKSKINDVSTTDGIASFPATEAAPRRLRKKPPGSPLRSRKRERR